MSKTILSPLHLHALHHAEFGQFISRFFDDFSRTDLSEETDTDFKAIFDTIKSKLPTYNKALEQIHSHQESKKIAELDKIRDSDMQALKDSIKPYKNKRTDAVKKAYNALKLVLDQYKDYRKSSYEAQTNKTNTLLSVLQSQEYKSHIATLNIQSFITDLDQSNKAFDTLFAQRSFDILQKEPLSVKNIRKEITKEYQKMTLYITTLSKIKQDTFYKKVLEVINNSRKYYSDILAIRMGKK